jgi:hypothetical protein
MTTILTRLLTLLPWCHRAALADAQRQIDALSARCDLQLDCIRSQRATISGLSLQLCRRDDKAEHAAATGESLRLQLQACRRHNETLLAQFAEEAQRVIELEAEASGWITRGVERVGVSEN